MPLPAAQQAAQSDIWLSCLSTDTRKAYEARKSKWLDFCQSYRRSPTDLSSSNIIDYLTVLATVANKGAPFAYSSIQSYVGFLGRASSFTSPNTPNPVDDPAVQMFLKGIARRLGKAKEKAEPCTLAHLKMLTNHALARPLDIEAQTVALVALIAFWGCLRLGSLIPKSADKLGQVVTTSSIQLRGTTMLLTLHHSKTIQFAERKHCIEIPAQADPLLCPLAAYVRWTQLLRSPTSQTPLCALSPTSPPRLSHSRFLQLVNKIVSPLPPLTGHSFRRGFVRLAFARGVPVWQIMHHGDWKTLEVAMSYAEDATIPNPLGGLPP